MTYPTKVDGWAWPFLLLTMAAGPLCMAFGAYQLIVESGSGWVMIGTGVLVLGIAILLCWPVHYTLTEESLVIRFGLIRSRISYAKIEEVYPTRSLLGSPAWSLDRLWINYDGGFVMISPEDKDAFLTDLASRHEALRLDSGKISRAN